MSQYSIFIGSFTNIYCKGIHRSLQEDTLTTASIIPEHTRVCVYVTQFQTKSLLARNCQELLRPTQISDRPPAASFSHTINFSRFIHAFFIELLHTKLRQSSFTLFLYSHIYHDQSIMNIHEYRIHSTHNDTSCIMWSQAYTAQTKTTDP